MEVKILNAILSKQADREKLKKNLLIFGVNDSYLRTEMTGKKRSKNITKKRWKGS